MGREGLDEQTVTTIRDTFNDHFDTPLPAMLKGKDNAKFENAEVVAGDDDENYDPVRVDVPRGRCAEATSPNSIGN